MVGSSLGRYRYYRCQNAWSSTVAKRCSLRYVNADWLEDALWGRVSAAMQSPEVVVAELQRQRREEHPDLRQRLTEVERQLQACSRYETQLVRLFGYGEIDEETVRREGGRNKQKRQTLLQRMAELETQKQTIDELERALAGLQAFCERVAKNVADLSFPERRQLLAAVTLSGVVHPDKVEARVVFPRLYATIAQTSA